MDTGSLPTGLSAVNGLLTVEAFALWRPLAPYGPSRIPTRRNQRHNTLLYRVWHNDSFDIMIVLSVVSRMEAVTYRTEVTRYKGSPLTFVTRLHLRGACVVRRTSVILFARNFKYLFSDYSPPQGHMPPQGTFLEALMTYILVIIWYETEKGPDSVP